MNWKEKTEEPVIDEQIFLSERILHLFRSDETHFVIVNAAHGYGKTASFAAMARETSSLWYTVEKKDNQSEVFCRGLIKLLCEKDEALQEEGAEDCFFELLQELKKSSRKRFLILDNVQELQNDAVFQMLLRMWDVLKEKLSLVLLTNRPVPGVLLQHILTGRIELYREEELRLDTGMLSLETADRPAVSEENMAQIVQAWNGWPLGIRFSLRCKKEDLDFEGEGLRSVLHQMPLSQYLDEYICRECTGLQQELLKRVSVLQEFCWELCQEISEKTLTRKEYETMLAEKAFLLAPTDRTGYYRICDAFRMYFEEMLSAAEKERIYKKAAKWYYRQDEDVQAAEYAVKGRKLDFLKSMLEKKGQKLLEKYGTECVGRIVSCLEEEQTVLSPEALGNAAQFYYAQGDYVKMDTCLNAADSSFGKENKFACYRSLYRALLKYDEDREKYGKQINHALFFLKESKQSIPYLKENEQDILALFLEKEKTPKEKRLKVQTFGSFAVTVREDGRELAWRTKKGKELFVYLLTLDGKPVERRKLIELLWQEEIPENAVAMLHNMIYNIRKELSAYCLDDVLRYENKKYSLNMKEISCDFLTVDMLAAYVEKKDIMHLKEYCEYFMQYWGGYLEDIDNYWITEKREYYEEIYKKGCWLLAEAFLEEKSDAAAVKLYENILMLEPYSEKAVERILHIYGAQRKWEKVKRCYQEFRTMLKRDLGIVPGEEVSAAYHYYLK